MESSPALKLRPQVDFIFFIFVVSVWASCVKGKHRVPTITKQNKMAAKASKFLNPSSRDFFLLKDDLRAMQDFFDSIYV